MSEKIFISRDYDYISLYESINLLCKKYTFLRKKSIGKSVLGKEIVSIQAGNPENLCLFAAAFHGSEHITTNVLMMWLEELCSCFENDESIGGINVKRALNSMGIIVIPTVNPDGCDISILGANRRR